MWNVLMEFTNEAQFDKFHIISSTFENILCHSTAWMISQLNNLSKTNLYIIE